MIARSSSPSKRGVSRCARIPASIARTNMTTFTGALADEAASGAADTYGYDNATMTVSANFLRPARITDEYLSVVAVVQHAGKRTVVAEVSIARPNGEVVFRSTYTMAVFETRIGE